MYTVRKGETKAERKERIRLYQQAWRAANKDRVREYNKRYREEHYETYRKSKEKYRKRNLHRWRFYSKTSYQKRKAQEKA